MKARIALVAAIALLAPAAFVASIVASPASGVAPTLLARGTYEPFKESAVRDSPVEFKAKTKSPIDVVVRRHDYAIGSTTGWHTHPGPVFITVTQGQLTYYLYDDESARRTWCRRDRESSTTAAGTWSATSPANSRRT